MQAIIFFCLTKFVSIMSTLTTIRYCLQKCMNTKSTAYAKYYAQPVSQGTVNLDELAAHISDHGSVYTRDVVVGVMTKMVDCINELLAQGYKVKLGELGTFYNSIRNDGKKAVDDPSKFDVAQIAGVNLRFLPFSGKKLGGKFNNTSTTRADRHAYECMGIKEANKEGLLPIPGKVTDNNPGSNGGGGSSSTGGSTSGGGSGVEG